MRGRHKYGAKPSHDGVRFWASQAERDRGAELALLQQAGHITELMHQPSVELTAGIKFRPDFRYVEGTRLVFEDVKGIVTEAARLKYRLWRAYGPAVLRLTRRAGRRQAFLVFKEILPKGDA